MNRANQTQALDLPPSITTAAEDAERIKSLDNDKTYLDYCRTGRRSNAATAKMKELGFGKLYNFAGSMVEWEKAGKPVEKGE